MSPTDWAVVAGSATTSGAVLLGAGKFVIRGWLNELRPNHGSSLHDRVSRIERRVDDIYDHLITKR